MSWSEGKFNEHVVVAILLAQVSRISILILLTPSALVKTVLLAGRREAGGFEMGPVRFSHYGSAYLLCRV